MPRYIDKDIVLEKMKNWHTKERLMDCVRYTPSVDVVKVKHGEWIDNCNGTFTCSLCGARASKMHYCGNCGAKMV